MAQYKPGTTINALPHPRIAVLMQDDDVRAEWVEALSNLVETVAGVEHIRDANWSEFDCVVTDRGLIEFDSREIDTGHYGSDRSYEYSWTQRFASHLDVFVRFGSPEGYISSDFLAAWPEESEWSAEVPEHVLRAKNRVVGSHVTRVEGLPESIASVVDQALAPQAKCRDLHLTFELTTRQDLDDVDESPGHLRPLLLGPDEAPLAVTFERSSGASAWIVPEDTGDPVGMFRAAYSEWSAKDKVRYPPLPDWANDRRFMSADEMAILEQLEELDAQFEAAKENHAADRAALLTAFDKAKREHGEPARLLLNGAGHDLESAVAESLRDLGFEVEEMDEQNATSKREDLRVRDSDDPDWIAICEVKGYTGGAGVDAIRQVDHHAGLYAAAHGRLPTKWIIVNAQRKRAPDTRESPYVTRGDDVAHLRETNGLVLDTRALFEIARAVKQGSSLAPEVRKSLRGVNGVVDSGSALIPPTGDTHES